MALLHFDLTTTSHLGILGADLGSTGHERLHGGKMPRQGGPVQRGAAVGVEAIDACPCPNEALAGGEVAGDGGQGERGGEFPPGQVGIEVHV